MGSGKTTFAAKMNAKNCFDLDHEVLEKHGKGFSHLGELIEAKGWENFRKLEALELAGFCRKDEDEDEELLLSLGGGALNQQSLELIRSKKFIKLVWLDTPFELCLERVSNDKKRPLMVRRSEAELRTLYSERSKFYSQCHIKLGVNEQNKMISMEALRKCLI